MPILPPSTAPPLSFRGIDVITDALIEIGMLAAGETPDGETGQWAFRKLLYLWDMWSGRGLFVYSTTLNTYTLVPNLSPHTIGPDAGATFTVAQRPVDILRATVILNNVTPNVEVPLTKRDSQWWMEDVTIKALTSEQPTDFYYSADFPNGSIYFWPVPTVAYGTRLELWVLMPQLTSIQDEIGGAGGPGTLPPAYRNALMLSLAEQLIPGSGKGQMPGLIANAALARRTVFGNNSQVPRLQTRDSGVPSADLDTRASNFNYRSRSFF